MAPVASRAAIFTYDKKAKEKVRKHGAVHVPEGQSLPDVNRFLAELVNGTNEVGGQRRITRHRRKKTNVESDQITVKTDDTRLGKVASGAKAESKAIAAEDPPTSEVADEDVDAPHDIEADSHVVAAFGDNTPDAQQVETPSNEETFGLAAFELPTETAKSNQDVCEAEDSVMCGTDTANAPNESEEDSFVDLLEIGLNDLLEMETEGSYAPSGSVDNKRVCILEGGPSDSTSDREADMGNIGGDGLVKDTAEIDKAAPLQERKTPKTPSNAARVSHATESTQRIHRFLYLVSRQIRLAREQGDLEIEQGHLARADVEALGKVQPTAQHRGNRDVGLI
ncbi:hypothetical protein CGGC5_v005840 [Colletotrichum fructicola Nara gc5]|uniref:Uncharacterized protein n=1 Tax=Colletotrichum fructicola (strain Nara gc5) TaxID=1213859 RepID=A0A7J6J849_COLFN|nr:hypothetical protein CGGC5_v005840 [Colletotrichum fructicola Nara gc5]